MSLTVPGSGQDWLSTTQPQSKPDGQSSSSSAAAAGAKTANIGPIDTIFSLNDSQLGLNDIFTDESPTTTICQIGNGNLCAEDIEQAPVNCASFYVQHQAAYILMEDNGTTQMALRLKTHMQMGHFGFAAVRKILGMPASKDNPICHSSEITRATQSAMQQESNRPRAGAVLRRMWMDIGFGRMSNLVFQAYMDDHSRRIWVHKLKDKSETLTAFIPLQRQLENEVHPRKLGAVARDNDRCYTGQNWKVYAAEHGIELEFYGPHRKETPMERAMQSLGGPARAYMHHGNAPETDMFYAIEHQAFCLNYRPHKGNPDDRSPMSMWQGVKLKRTERMTKGVMFCLAYGFIYPEERAKNDNRSFPAIFLGCHHSERSYRLRCLNSGKIYWVCDVKFVCNIMPYRQNMPGRISHHDPNYVDLEPDEFDEHGTTDDRLAAREHLGRVREMSGAALQKFSTFTACTAANDPTTWDEAMAGPDAAEWREAAAIEDANHKANGTWIMVDRSEAIGHKIFWPKLVLKTKMLPPCLEYPNGKIDKRKVRKTIQAFKATLRNGVDYRESYATTPQWNSIRMIFAVACYFDLDLTLKDIVAYFLAAYLEAGEDIFMEQEPRTDDGTGRLCKLIKSMYGLPQAAYHAQRKLMAALQAGEGWATPDGQR